MSRSSFPALLASLALLLAPSLNAQDLKELEQNMKQKYEGKVLVLRGFYTGRHLRYDPNGKPLKRAQEGAWSVDGGVQIERVKLAEKTLEILGKRVYARYLDELKDFEYVSSEREVKIEAELSTTFPEVAATELVQRIFLTGDEKLSDHVPPYWQNFLRSWEGRGSKSQTPNGPAPAKTDPQSSATGASTQTKIHSIGGEVSPPRCISCPNPRYTEAARQYRHEGKTVLWAVLSESGRVESITIAKPLGMGLDEEAVEAVQKWRFEPARRNGEPIATRFTLEVNFHFTR